MSCAGKSGTTSNNNDVWFVGFTPYYTAGIWAGFDNNQDLSDANGGNSFHKDIWRKIMQKIHEGKEDTGFPVPTSVEQAVICRKSGKLAVPGVCSGDPRGDATYLEYFAKGTVPTEMCDKHSTVTVCAESGGLPSAYCTEFMKKVIMIVPESDEETDDSVFVSPGYCQLHLSPSVPETQAEPDNGSPGTTKPAVTDQPVGPGYQSVTPVTEAGPGILPH